jgi:hypothetical protein
MVASRNESHLIKACAEEHGLKVRAVQIWRQKGDSRWIEFLRRRAAASESVSQMSLIQGTAQVLTPKHIEEAAAIRLARLSASADQLLERGELSALIQVNKAANDCHKLLVDQQARNAELEVQTGQLVKAELVRDYINTNLTLVKQQIENLPNILAARIESTMDVKGVVRFEVETILNEISVAAGSAPWFSKPSSSVGVGTVPTVQQS